MTKQFVAGFLMIASVSLCNVSLAADRADDKRGPQAKAVSQEKKVRRIKKNAIAEKKAHVRLAKAEEKRQIERNKHNKNHWGAERKEYRKEHKKHRRNANQHAHRHASHDRYYSSHNHDSHRRYNNRYIVRHANSHDDFYGRYYGFYDRYGDYREYDYGHYDRRGRYQAHYHSSHCGHRATPLLGAVVAGILISNIFDL